MLRLLEIHGGANIYIPEKAEGSKLSDNIGIDAARALIAHIGYGEMKIPLCKPWRIALLREAGMSINDISRRLLVSRSMVQRTLGEKVARRRSCKLRRG